MKRLVVLGSWCFVLGAWLGQEVASSELRVAKLQVAKSVRFFNQEGYLITSDSVAAVRIRSDHSSSVSASASRT